MHRAARRQVLGQVTPLAARLQNVQHAVQHRPKIDAAVPATAPRRWDERLDDPPFLIAQVAWVAQPAAVMALSFFRHPHPCLRLGGTFQSQLIHSIQFLLGRALRKQSLRQTRCGSPCRHQSPHHPSGTIRNRNRKPAATYPVDFGDGRVDSGDARLAIFGVIPWTLVTKQIVRSK